MGYDAEKAEDDYWADPLGAELEAAEYDAETHQGTSRQPFDDDFENFLSLPKGYLSASALQRRVNLATPHVDGASREGIDAFRKALLDAKRRGTQVTTARGLVHRAYGHLDSLPTEVASEHRYEPGIIHVNFNEPFKTGTESESSTMRRPTKREALEAQLLRISEALAELDRMPSEPQKVDGQPTVIHFKKKFHENEREYPYVAIKAPDGLWYTSGPKSPKGYTWDQLIEWFERTGPMPTIYTMKLDALHWADEEDSDG